MWASYSAATRRELRDRLSTNPKASKTRDIQEHGHNEKSLKFHEVFLFQESPVGLLVLAIEVDRDKTDHTSSLGTCCREVVLGALGGYSIYRSLSVLSR